jgi:hypothetical protein
VWFYASKRHAELQVLHRNERGDLAWQRVCEAPCVTAATVNTEWYRVSGDGITTSSAFQIAQGPYALPLHARAGSSEARSMGAALMVLGGGLVVGGIALAAGSGDDESPDGKGSGGEITIAIFGLLAGNAMLWTGLVMVLTNDTQVTFGSGLHASVPRLEIGRGVAIGPRGLEF